MVVNWGILGSGAIADKCTAPAILKVKNAKLVAVMRRDLEKARDFAKKYGVKKYYGSVEELLSDEEVDAVYVATPIYVHAEETIQAAESGKHVLVEKPMAMTAKECQDMINACNRNNVKLMVCYYQRFNARHQKIKEMLTEGLIGQVNLGRAQFSLLYPEIEGAWRQIPKMGGGGSIMDVGSHCIDLLRYLLGEVTEVGAFADTLVFKYPVEDTATIIMKFNSGAHGVVTSNWSSPDFDQISLNIFELYGTKGRIVSSPINAKNSEGFLKAYTADKWTEHYFEQNTHVALLEEFGRCIEEDKKSPIPGEEGMMGMKIISAAYESAKSGKMVKVK